jgi:hypothetical protein
MVKKLKMLVKKLPYSVYLFAFIAGFSVMEYAEKESIEYMFVGAVGVLGFIGLMLHWSTLDNNYTAKD